MTSKRRVVFLSVMVILLAAGVWVLYRWPFQNQSSEAIYQRTYIDYGDIENSFDGCFYTLRRAIFRTR